MWNTFSSLLPYVSKPNATYGLTSNIKDFEIFVEVLRFPFGSKTQKKALGSLWEYITNTVTYINKKMPQPCNRKTSLHIILKSRGTYAGGLNYMWTNRQKCWNQLISISRGAWYYTLDEKVGNLSKKNLLGILKATIILAHYVELKARGKDYYSKCSFFFLTQILPGRNGENVDFNLSDIYFTWFHWV